MTTPDDSIRPAFTLRWQVPAPARIEFLRPMPQIMRVALERALHGLGDPMMRHHSIWRTYFYPANPPNPSARPAPMPASPAAAPVAPPPAEPRARRSQAAELHARFAARAEAARLQGCSVESPVFPVESWLVLLVGRPGDECPHIYLQPPTPLVSLLRRLWDVGLRIDGFDFDPYDASLHTCVRDLNQMPLVDDLIRWLNAYLTGTAPLDQPPAPYQLRQSPSLTEHIVAFDNPAAVTTNPRT